MSDAPRGRQSPDSQTDRSFTLLIIIQWFKPKLNRPNQERERRRERKLICVWKTSSRFCQCRLLMSGTRRVITAKYSSSSVETCGGPITGWNGAYIHKATKVVGGILGLLSYLKTFWRSAQQSFTSLCFCVTPAARAGWRLDSWDTLTSSIYHTQACRLVREGFRIWPSDAAWGEKMFPTMIWLAMSRISLSPKLSTSMDADRLFLWKKRYVTVFVSKMGISALSGKETIKLPGNFTMLLIANKVLSACW